MISTISSMTTAYTFIHFLEGDAIVIWHGNKGKRTWEQLK